MVVAVGHMMALDLRADGSVVFSSVGLLQPSSVGAGVDEDVRVGLGVSECVEGSRDAGQPRLLTWRRPGLLRARVALVQSPGRDGEQDDHRERGEQPPRHAGDSRVQGDHDQGGEQPGQAGDDGDHTNPDDRTNSG